MFGIAIFALSVLLLANLVWKPRRRPLAPAGVVVVGAAVFALPEGIVIGSAVFGPGMMLVGSILLMARLTRD